MIDKPSFGSIPIDSIIIRVKESENNRLDRGTSPKESDTRKAINIRARIISQAIVCSECSTATIAEHDTLTSNTILYDFESYLNNIKVKHRHPCDARTRARVLEMVIAEQRLLEVWDPNDFAVYPDQNVAISLDGEQYCSLDNSLDHSIKGSNVVSFCQDQPQPTRVNESDDRRANSI